MGNYQGILFRFILYGRLGISKTTADIRTLHYTYIKQNTHQKCIFQIHFNTFTLEFEITKNREIWVRNKKKITEYVKIEIARNKFAFKIDVIGVLLVCVRNVVFVVRSLSEAVG